MYSQIVKAARIQSVERVGKSMAIRCAFVVCINYNRRARDREREKWNRSPTLWHSLAIWDCVTGWQKSNSSNNNALSSTTTAAGTCICLVEAEPAFGCDQWRRMRQRKNTNEKPYVSFMYILRLASLFLCLSLFANLLVFLFLFSLFSVFIE